MLIIGKFFILILELYMIFMYIYDNKFKFQAQFLATSSTIPKICY